MPNFSRSEIILVRYPFSDLSSTKVRPAVVVGVLSGSADYLVVPLTSKTNCLTQGEFELSDWQAGGLNVPTALKRGIYTVHSSLILKSIGNLLAQDAIRVEQSLRQWLHLR